MTFAIAAPGGGLPADGTFRQIVAKDLPAGDWAVVATVNTTVLIGTQGDRILDAVCELRSPAGVMGWAADRRLVLDSQRVRRNLSMNGGAHLPGGGAVSVWCMSQGTNEEVDQVQLMATKIGGFF